MKPSKSDVLSEVDHRCLKAAELMEAGKSLRGAAKAVGMDPSNLQKAMRVRETYAPALQAPQKEARRKQLGEMWGKIAEKAGGHLNDKLDDPESLTAKELAVIGGIATDKVSVAEGWQRQEQGGSSFLAALTANLAQSGMLKLEVIEPDPVEFAVNVTPGAEKRDR